MWNTFLLHPEKVHDLRCSSVDGFSTAISTTLMTAPCWMPSRLLRYPTLDLMLGQVNVPFSFLFSGINLVEVLFRIVHYKGILPLYVKPALDVCLWVPVGRRRIERFAECGLIEQVSFALNQTIFIRIVMIPFG